MTLLLFIWQSGGDSIKRLQFLRVGAVLVFGQPVVRCRDVMVATLRAEVGYGWSFGWVGVVAYRVVVMMVM